MGQRSVNSILQISFCFLASLLLTVSESLVVSATTSSSVISIHTNPAHIKRSPLGYLTAMSADRVDGVPDILKTSTDHNVIVNYENKRLGKKSDELLREIENDDGLQNAISSIKVQGYGSIASWTLLSSALSRIRRLDELLWSNMNPVPASVLSVLEQCHPECKLHYEMPFSNWDRYDRSVPPIQSPGKEIHHPSRAAARALILNSSNLHSLKAAITYGRDANTEDLMLVHRIFVTCHNLKELDLSIQHQGCVVGGGQPYHFDFSSGNPLANATFPALEVLRLRNYRLENNDYDDSNWIVATGPIAGGDLRWPLSQLPIAVLDVIGRWNIDFIGGFKPASRPEYFGYGHVANLDAWLERMDWTKLRSLDLGHASTSILQKLRPVLTNLETLKLNGGTCSNAASVVEFLQNATKSQTSLSLYNFHFNSFDPLIETLTLKHHSLQALLLAESEYMRSHPCYRTENQNHPIGIAQGRSGAWYDPHLYLNALQLGQLSKSCSMITELDIDVDRALPLSELKHLFATLVTFPQLQSLTTRFESPFFLAARNGSTDASINDYPRSRSDPLFNQSFVKELFHDLRMQQQQQQRELLTSNPDSSTTSHTGTPTTPPPPALKHFKIIIGDCSKDYSGGSQTTSSTKYLLGWWTCTVNDETGAEECKGQLQWARSGYEDIGTGSIRSFGDDYDDEDEDDDEEEEDEERMCLARELE